YVTAALHLGRFNGAYATDRPLPDASFLTRTYLRGWTNWIPWLDAARAEETWSHPLAAAAFPTPLVARLRRLQGMVTTLFDRLALGRVAREPHRGAIGGGRPAHDRGRLVLRGNRAGRPGGRDPRWRESHL